MPSSAGYDPEIAIGGTFYVPPTRHTSCRRSRLIIPQSGGRRPERTILITPQMQNNGFLATRFDALLPGLVVQNDYAPRRQRPGKSTWKMQNEIERHSLPGVVQCAHGRQSNTLAEGENDDSAHSGKQHSWRRKRLATEGGLKRRFRSGTSGTRQVKSELWA